MDVISRLISQLGDQDPSSRDKAVRALQLKGAQCFFHYWNNTLQVLGLLSHPDQRTRADVVRLLVKSDRNFILARLISILRGKYSQPAADAKTRCKLQVLDALALLRPESGVAIPFLVEMLSSPSIEITLKRAARKALQEIVTKKERAIVDFMEGLLSQDQSLMTGRPPPAKDQPRMTSGRALEAAGRRALPLIIKWMKRVDPLLDLNTCYLQNLSRRHLAGRRWAAVVLLRSVKTLPSRFHNTSLSLGCALGNLGPVLIPLVRKDLTHRGLDQPHIAFGAISRLSAQDLRPLIPDLLRALRVHGGTSIVGDIVGLLGKAHPPAPYLIPRLIRTTQDFREESHTKKNCCGWKEEVILSKVAKLARPAEGALRELLKSGTHVDMRAEIQDLLGKIYATFEQEVIGRLVRTAPGRFRIDRETLRKVISRSSYGADGAVMVLLTARLVLDSPASGAKGLTVSALAPVGTLNRLGMKQGDRLESLNGIRLESVAALRQAYAKIISSDELSFTLRRGKMVHVVHLEVSR